MSSTPSQRGPSDTADRSSSALSALFGGAQEVTAPDDGRDVLEHLRDGLTVPPERRTLAGRALHEEDLSALDLTGWDLTGADLSRADLRGTRLVRARLNGAVLYEADLERAECLGADFTAANLVGANLASAGCGKANFEGAQLVDAKLEGAALNGAVFDHADLRSAHLAGARALEASWRDVNLAGADLRQVEFDQGSVAGARFDGADLREASLVRLDGYLAASWIGVDLRDIDFTGAHLCRRFIMDQNYIQEFRSQTRWSELVYRAWWLTSDCGRSIVRWGACTGVLVMLYAWLYTFVDVSYGEHQTVLSPIYYSVVTLTSLGYGDALPASAAAQLVAMAEVLCGYVMLGGLLSIISNKMVRRSD